MPAESLDPPQPRPSCSTCVLLRNVLRILATDDCEIVITTLLRRGTRAVPSSPSRALLEALIADHQAGGPHATMPPALPSGLRRATLPRHPRRPRPGGSRRPIR